MTLAEISIRRPVLTIVISLLIVLAGAISLLQLGIREYPAVDPPTLSITTSYPGAAAEVVQAQITEPIEEAVNSVAGIRTLTSTSREGASSISAEFSLDTDLDTAASDVRDQVARAVRNLPPDTNPPILNKSHADSQPIFGLALSSATRSQLELGAYADSLRERLQTVPGIAGVDQPAEKRYAMRLWMDPEKLAAYGLSPLDVRQALARENIELPSGRIEGESVELPVKTLSRLNTAEEFNALIVKRSGDSIVRFRDIGYAQLGAQNERGALKMGDVPIAGLYFKQQPGANQIEIVDELRRRLEQIRKEVPPDIDVKVAYDNTEYVRRSLLEVTETIFIAFVLVVLVVFAFLREWRTTLIPVIAIPVSIIGTFGVMFVAGFSINTLSLLGIVLAIGLVVDDAIVVLENIYSKIESGMPPVQAGIDGTREIFMAVISTTITLAVVFLPLLFMGGLSGRLFREFGLTIAGAVMISALVALTLTPMLCSRLLRPHQSHGALFRRTEELFAAMEQGYARGLAGFLNRRRLALGVLAVAAIVIALFFEVLPRELSPMEDRGRIWVRATAPEGVGYEYMQRFMDDLTAATADRVPEANMMMTQVPGAGGGPGIQGPINNGFVRVFLKDKTGRERSQAQIADDLQGLTRQFTAARVNITQEASIGERRSNQSGVQFVVQAADFEQLQEVLPKFLEEARQSPAFTFVDSDLKFSKPEVRVSLEREKAQALGVSTLDIAQTLQSALSGQRFGYFIFNGKQYDVIGQLTRDFRSRPDDLSNIAVRSVAGDDMVRLDNLVSFEESSSPPELYRFNRYAAATVSGTLANGRTMGEGIAAFEQTARDVLDERFTTSLTGAARDFVESASSLGWVFLLALILIYLVLAAQFESFVDPFVILLTVPLALAGALFSLWYFGQTLNIFSQIGLIMLVGLVTKNGILIVEFANQRRDAGDGDALAAVKEAAAARLRPILMTTLATILGIVPIALALGAGSESRVSMGIAVIGGLLCGGLLTLYVIPAMYVLLSRKRGAAAAESTITNPAGALPPSLALAPSRD
ncbi:MAG TPA: efflux RND transporter permease subunit [Povalibacter sp.]|uniref:efflux RND transporter permease subunit n=1 Tax=Povalibacter sp. TaxID=1962978 RepID=UPI002B84A6FD|nr:efflux RND transporter permease subunit [Povalibacter sp.]HMN43689.1 efflux RND transporter permease subunit [Povalibacter sp.]